MEASIFCRSIFATSRINVDFTGTPTNLFQLKALICQLKSEKKKKRRTFLERGIFLQSLSLGIKPKICSFLAEKKFLDRILYLSVLIYFFITPSSLTTFFYSSTF